MSEKICTKCGISKNISDFYKNSRNKNKVRSCCKNCYLKFYPHKTNDKSRQTWQKYRKSEKGLITQLLNNARDRAKRKNLPFELDKSWVIEKIKSNTCELSGIQFIYESIGEYRANPFAPSIDKINPLKGYTKDNSRLVVFCVNMARSDWGDEILFKMSKSIVNNNNF